MSCWGLNRHGRLGNGSTSDAASPVDVLLLDDVVQISAREGTCAVRASGQVWCWGRNDQGQIGDGTLVDRTIPTRVSGIDDAIFVSAGSEQHACAIRRSGRVSCWGGNVCGQLGDGTRVSSPTPVEVPGLP